MLDGYSGVAFEPWPQDTGGAFEGLDGSEEIAMFDGHITGQLASYLDGELPLRERQRVEQHLAACEVCRIERDQVRSGMSMMNELPLAQAPDAIWHAIEGFCTNAAADHERRRQPVLMRHWLPALAAFAIVAAAGVAYWISSERHQGSWEVVGIC